MKKPALQIATALMMIAFLGACSSVHRPAGEPIGHHGTGNVVEYHPNGKVKREAEYRDGELLSVVTFYASGTEESNERYMLGEIHAATYYFADGRVKTKISSN